MTKDEFGTEWHNKIDEVIRKYQPDCIWFDGSAGNSRNHLISEERLLRKLSPLCELIIKKTAQ